MNKSLQIHSPAAQQFLFSGLLFLIPILPHVFGGLEMYEKQEKVADAGR